MCEFVVWCGVGCLFEFWISVGMMVGIDLCLVLVVCDCGEVVVGEVVC